MLREVHLFAITSLADNVASVVLEALAHGVPVLCLDHCGFHDVVTDACGIKVPVCHVSQVTQALANSVVKLWEDERLRQRLSVHARQRVQAFAWDQQHGR